MEVFQSVALAEVFKGATQPAGGSQPAPSVFGEEAPGTYIQIAQRGAPTTNRVLIALGNTA